jgi:hypothetical protein
LDKIGLTSVPRRCAMLAHVRAKGASSTIVRIAVILGLAAANDTG